MVRALHPLLRTLNQQRQRLVEAGVPEADFCSVDLKEPEQDPAAYTILFYVPDKTYSQGDPASTLEFYLQMLGEELTVCRWFESPETVLRLHSRCEHYPTGVHRVVIDLTANWSQVKGRSMQEVFDEEGPPLAGVEALAAYALSSPRLIRWQDGVKLPFCDTGITNQNIGGILGVLYFAWDGENMLILNEDYSISASYSRSAPVVTSRSSKLAFRSSE